MTRWFAKGLRFECTQCGRCCSGPSGSVWFQQDELERMAAHFGMLPFEFLQRYAVKQDGRWSLAEVDSEHGKDCVFLERDGDGRARCSIYELRPLQCRTWPFWSSNLTDAKAWERAARECPGIGQGPLFPAEVIERRANEVPR